MLTYFDTFLELEKTYIFQKHTILHLNQRLSRFGKLYSGRGDSNEIPGYGLKANSNVLVLYTVQYCPPFFEAKTALWFT